MRQTGSRYTKSEKVIEIVFHGRFFSRIVSLLITKLLQQTHAEIAVFVFVRQLFPRRKPHYLSIFAI